MTTLQKIVTGLVPASWAKSMEAESRAWKVRCACGQEKSVWDTGGIRWKAAGSPRRYGHCSHCGRSSWLTVVKDVQDGPE